MSWRRLAALVAVAAVTVAVGSVRLDRIDAPGERLVDGQPIAGTADLTGRPQPGPFGASAEVELTSGSGRGARLLARLPRGMSLGADVAPGTELGSRGASSGPRRGRETSTLPPTCGDAGSPGTHGARGGHDRPPARRAARSGRRVRERALAGIASGLPPALGALGQGMVLGADEDVPETVREDFRDAGLSHVLAASGTNVMLLVALAIPLLAVLGLSYGARIPS